MTAIRRLLLLSLLLVLAPSALRAQTLADYDYDQLRFRGIGIAYGYVLPDKVEPTSAYSVRIDLGYLGPGVRIIPSLSYWSSELDEDELRRLADQIGGAQDLGTVEWSDLSLNLDAHFVWTTAGLFVRTSPVLAFPYVGAGVGVHFLNGEGEAIEDTFVEDLMDSLAPGMTAIAGIGFKIVDRFRLYSESRFTLLGGPWYAEFRIGGQFMLSRESPDASAPR